MAITAGNGQRSGNLKDEEKYQKREDPTSYGWGIRHLQIAVMALSTCVAISLRINLSVAIVAMVRYENQTSSDLAPTYEWGEDIQGYVLSSFFGGYFLLQIPAGIMSSRFGGHRFLCGSVLGSSVLTLVMPQCAYTGGWLVVCINRFLQGICQAFLFPAAFSLIGLWSPPHERSSFTSIALGGQHLGAVVSSPLAGLLSAKYGWPSVFYFFGATGVAISTISIFFGSDFPRSHKMISNEERQYIESSLGGSKVQMSVPWKNVLTSSAYWSALTASSCATVVYLTLMTKIPTYLSTVWKFEMEDSGFLTSLPYLVAYILSFFYAWVCDFITSRNFVSLTTARKIFNSIAHWGAATSILVIAHSTDRTLSVILLTAYMGLQTANGSGVEPNYVDLAPNFSGPLFSLANFVGCFLGLLGPITVGLIVTESGSASQWRIVFNLLATFMVAGNIVFILFSTAKTQWWNWPDRYTEKTRFEETEKCIELSEIKDESKMPVISRD